MPALLTQPPLTMPALLTQPHRHAPQFALRALPPIASSRETDATTTTPQKCAFLAKPPLLMSALLTQLPLTMPALLTQPPLLMSALLTQPPLTMPALLTQPGEKGEKKRSTKSCQSHTFQYLIAQEQWQPAAPQPSRAKNVKMLSDFKTWTSSD